MQIKFQSLQKPYVSLSRKDWILRCLIICILAAGFTFVCVSISENVGRLSTVPTYDDCSYMLSAEFRHFFWNQGGLKSLWLSFKEVGIHSPFSELLASISYIFFGHNDRAPYLANGIVILAYLLALTWLLRGMPSLPWLASLAIFASLPIAKMAVMEFRPDVFWGISLAFGAVYILISPKLLKGKKEAFLAGALFAIAYLAKPSTFVLTTVVFLASFGGRLFHAWWMRQEERVTLAEALRCIAIVGILLFGLAGWYYIAFGSNIWNYFYVNTFGVNKHHWSIHGTWLRQLNYYLNGSGSESTLGTLGRIALLFMAALFIWRFFVTSRSEKLRCLLLASIGVLIYTIITLGSAKSVFLGAPLHIFAIFTTAYLLNCFFLNSSLLSRGLVTGSLILCAIIAMWRQGLPPYSDWRNEPCRDTCREATDWVVDILQSMESLPKSILFIQSGPVIPDAVHIRLLRRGQKPQFASLDWSKSMEEIRTIQKNKEMIVIPDLNAKGTTAHLPVTAFMPDILKELASDPEFSLFRTVQTSDGSLVYVYVNKQTLFEKTASQE